MIGDSIDGTAIWEDQTPAQHGFKVAVQNVETIEWRTGRPGQGPNVTGFVKGMAIMVGVVVALGVLTLGVL